MVTAVAALAANITVASVTLVAAFLVPVTILLPLVLLLLLLLILLLLLLVLQSCNCCYCYFRCLCVVSYNLEGSYSHPWIWIVGRLFIGVSFCIFFFLLTNIA